MSRSDDGAEPARDRPDRAVDDEPRHDRAELLADLRRVDGLTSGALSEREYAAHGEFGVTTFRRRFGSWNAAKREAGLRTREAGRIDEERLLADLRRVARSVEGTVTKRAYDDRGEFGVTTFHRRFGSWNAAKREAGLETERGERTTAAMADDVARVADEVDGPYVTPESYAERGEYPVAALPAEESFWADLRDRVGLAVTPLRHKVAGPE
ncbi:MAG: homing endonuclease associated repeat-containing protein [Haloferacaceae archaeon]